MMELLIWGFFAYLIGSFSSAVIVARALNLEDPRLAGSHNPGATNMLRLGGKKAAFLTLLGDLLKGLLVLVAAQILGYFTLFHLAIIMAAVVLGHIYPIFFDFRGGKGVATYLGALFGWDLFVFTTAISTALTWLFFAKVLRISSLSAIIALILIPVYAWVWSDASYEALSVLAGLSLITLYRHKSNIKRLLAGEESVFKKQK